MLLGRMLLRGWLLGSCLLLLNLLLLLHCFLLLLRRCLLPLLLHRPCRLLLPLPVEVHVQHGGAALQEGGHAARLRQRLSHALMHLHELPPRLASAVAGGWRLRLWGRAELCQRLLVQQVAQLLVAAGQDCLHVSSWVGRWWRDASGSLRAAVWAW
jgi:hypothetical protein